MLLTSLSLAAIGAATYALLPSPVQVEIAQAERGQMRVTVDEDGRTRIRERYFVSAPLAGRLARITLKEGDEVVAGQTILASLDPMDPTLLDPRARAEAEARVHAAESALRRADTMLGRANTELELTQIELDRIRRASIDNASTPIELERATSAEAMRLHDRQAAEFARDIARFDLDLAKAALVRTSPDPHDHEAHFDIEAPVSGRVLRVLQESSAVVQPGTPLVEVGDPSDLELVVDVLSSDGVAIRPGAPVTLEHWGGDMPLKGSVRRVEPAAFTKISALGVEEQRVNVIIDFAEPPTTRSGLGDAFRVEARIETWRGDDVLTVPTGAIFRHAEEWAVFRVVDGVARSSDVTIGRRNATQAQVLGGLAAGDSVIVYPSDRVRDGVRVAARETTSAH